MTQSNNPARQAALDALAKVDYHPRSIDDGHYDAGYDQEQAGEFLDKHIKTVYAALLAPEQTVTDDEVREAVERIRKCKFRDQITSEDINTLIRAATKREWQDGKPLDAPKKGENHD